MRNVQLLHSILGNVMEAEPEPSAAVILFLRTVKFVSFAAEKSI